MEDRTEPSIQAISPLYVDRGLFALRYVSAESTAWPTAEVFLPEEPDADVQQVCAPGARAGNLSGPGACVVLLANSPGLIRIGLRPAVPNGSLQAVIKLERLGFASSTAVPDERGSVAEAEAAEGVRGGDDRPEFSFVVHVARRGDVNVRPGQWAAGPDAPARIEGLMISSGDLASVRLEMQTMSQGGSGWSAWSGAGAFLGTRGRANPLVGVRARLVGPKARLWTLRAEAMFLGSPLIEREGREIELAGHFGADPIVGLRLGVKPAQVAGVANSLAVKYAPEPRLKVFRAGGVRR